MKESNSHTSASAHHAVKRWVQLAVAAGLMAPVLWYAAQYVRTHETSWSGLGANDLPAISLLLGVLALVMAMNGLVFRDLVGHCGSLLKLRTWLGLTLAASMLNIVSPIKGGAILRGVYLKRVHGIRYLDFAGILGISLLCSLAASGAVATLGLLARGVSGGRLEVAALLVCIGLVGLPFAVLQLQPLLNRVLFSRMRRLAQVADILSTVSSQPALVLRLHGWSYTGAACHAVAFVIAFRLAGFDGNWLVPVIASAFARIGALIAITPAGLGIFEAFGAVSAQMLGADTGPAVLGVLIVRVGATIVSLVGGVAFFPMLLGPHTDVRETSGPNSDKKVEDRPE